MSSVISDMMWRPNPDFSFGGEGGAPGLGPHVQRRVQVQPEHLSGKVGLHQPDAPLLHTAPHATRAGFFHVHTNSIERLHKSRPDVSAGFTQPINRTNEVFS